VRITLTKPSVYNPYDLINLSINGKPMHGRVVALDSDVTNQKTMTNAFGALVKPLRLATMCPDCAQGFDFEFAFADPPFPTVVYNCPYCKPGPSPLTNPFVNPVSSGRVPEVELNPILHNLEKPLDETTSTFTVPVAPKVPEKRSTKKPRKTKEAVSLPQKEIPPPAAASNPDPNELRLEKPKKLAPELAEGMGEELDFDDSEFVEE
jgi:hypothetical protein